MTEATMIVRGKEVRFLDDEDPRARVDRVDQIPQFPDEAAEQAWWSEHTLSEEFWRNAEPVPESDLPPTRAPRTAATNQAAPQARSGGSAGLAFFAGLVVGGVLVAGAVWWVSQFLAAGGSPGTDFLPTKAPHLSISSARVDAVLPGASRAAGLARVR